MKLFIGLLLASVALGAVFGVPAGSPNDDAEVIDVPRRQGINRRGGYDEDSDESSAGEPDFKDFKGVIDTGVGYPFLQPHPLPFSFNLGFFDAFEDIFQRLRNQLWSQALPDGDTISSFDSSKGNTTSTVKVVDGHKIEVNETVYGDSDNLFKVRLVNIRPLDSDEDVAETPDANANRPNPVTTAPRKDIEELESEERREPLEKNSNENEIKRNIDGPEHTEHHQSQSIPSSLAQLILSHTTMLPITNENNAANLNAAFVTDNSLEVAEEATGTIDSKGSRVQNSEEEIAEVVEIDGNIEAETNKSVNNSEIKKNMENLENDAVANDATTTVLVVEEITTIAPEEATTATFQDDAPSIEEEAAQEQTLTIENNEAMEANNSPNESSNSDVAADDAAAGSVGGEDVASKEATNAATSIDIENDDDADDLRAELDEENINETAASESTNDINEAVTTEPVKSVDDTAEWLDDDDAAAAAAAVTDASIAAASQPGSDIDEVDNESNEKRYANYANNKNREDISSSSDDEGENEAEAVQMNPEFDAEWADLKEDLAKASSEERNDLSNDIDAFDAVPIDLSNDIAVNYIAANNPDFPRNPEAEVFDGSDLKKPMFEKLTIADDALPVAK